MGLLTKNGPTDLNGSAGQTAPIGAASAPKAVSTRQTGAQAEDRALQALQQAGLRLVMRNYRTPGRHGGEIDLIMKDSDGTLVFVEVRQRARPRFGGAAASVDWRKRQRIVRGGRYYLMRFEHAPACRFDVVALEGASLQWIQAAFDAQESGF